MIATLLALLVWFAAHLSPAAATVSDAAGAGWHPSGAVEDRSTGPLSDVSPAPATEPLVDEPTCLTGEEWDGLRCVALQLPEETNGRDLG